MSSSLDTKAQIVKAIRDFQGQVPALNGLKLVMELELRGRGDIQLFRVEVPGPKITRDIASDAKVRLSVPRQHFNELVGGPKGGPNHLVDSNVDWGVDLLFLKKWLDEHPEASPLGLAYFGMFDPRVAIYS